MKNCCPTAEPCCHLGACPYGRKRRSGVGWMLQEECSTIVADFVGQAEEELEELIVRANFVTVHFAKLGEPIPIMRGVTCTYGCSTWQAEPKAAP
eukprot:3930779-Amphidinium_carterae.1